MAGWTGWAKDVLAGLGAPDTTKNRSFLVAWEAAEYTTCKFNPLSVSTDLKDASRCRELSNGRHALNYKSKADGAKATVAQLEDKSYLAIREAILSGDPYSYIDSQAVIDELGAWSASSFAAKYAADLTPPAPSSGQGQDSGTAYLEGGPCDGKTVKMTDAEYEFGFIACKGIEYQIVEPEKKHDGAVIFKSTGESTGQPPPQTLNSPHALSGWKAIQKSINKELPTTLHLARKVNAATLRTINRARKVKL